VFFFLENSFDYELKTQNPYNLEFFLMNRSI